MKVSVILGHPYEKSFNHAIFRTVVETLRERSHVVYAHDLYGENFDPLLSVEELGDKRSNDPVIVKLSDELAASDGLVVIHPNWWGQPPAIVTGWIDRVLRPGVAYAFKEGDSGGGVPEGLLAGKVGLVFNTSNTSGERENLVFGDPLQRIWMDCVFHFCGISRKQRRMFRVVADSGQAERLAWLAEVSDIVRTYFP